MMNSMNSQDYKKATQSALCSLKLLMKNERDYCKLTGDSGYKEMKVFLTPRQRRIINNKTKYVSAQDLDEAVWAKYTQLDEFMNYSEDIEYGGDCYNGHFTKSEKLLLPRIFDFNPFTQI